MTSNVIEGQISYFYFKCALFLRLPAFPLYSDFPFFYIHPTKKERKILKD